MTNCFRAYDRLNVTGIITNLNFIVLRRLSLFLEWGGRRIGDWVKEIMDPLMKGVKEIMQPLIGGDQNQVVSSGQNSIYYNKGDKCC